MPPHWVHAGPRSRPTMRAGWTGGVSVKAAVGGWTSPGWTGGAGGVPWAPAVGWSACADVRWAVPLPARAEPAAEEPPEVGPRLPPGAPGDVAPRVPPGAPAA